MINTRQEELIEELMKKIQDRYPGVRLADISVSPENASTVWIEVTAPDDEDLRIEIREFASDLVADIQIDYGYHMLVMPISEMVDAI